MNVLDLFSGACGGWSLGLHRAGFRTLAAVEIDEWRRRQFAANFPGARLYDDVRTVTAERLQADGVGPIDLVCGSPPCQDASSANTKGRGIDGARTGLYMEAVRIVREVRPRLCAFENVPGIRNRGIDRVLGELEAAGYAAWPLVVGALDLGAPHIRKRSWVVCADAATVHRLALPWDQSDGDSIGVAAIPAREQVGTAGQPRQAVPSDQPSDGRRQGWPGRSSASDPGEQIEFSTHAADTDEPDAAGRIEDRWRGLGTRAMAEDRTTGDAFGAGLEIECGEPGDDGPERSPLERAITERLGPIAQDWNGGIAGRLGMDARLPKGMARPMLAAYGDAILPQISEIIGRAIMRSCRHRSTG